VGFRLHHHEQLFANVLPVSRLDTTRQFVGKLYGVDQACYLDNELSILLALRQCPGIVSMHGIVRQDCQTALILERMDGDVLDLLDLPSFTAKQGRDIFIQTCKALQFCHQHEVAHLDIKPENLLYRTSKNTPSGYEIKLTDFGSSAFHRPRVSGFYGTMYYGAPEAVSHLRNQSKRSYDAKKADLWSLGILLHVLLTFTWPFDQNNCADVAEQILAHQVCINPSVPRRYRRIIGALLSPNPCDRPSIDWVLSELGERANDISGACSVPSSRRASRVRRWLEKVSRRSMRA